MLLAAALVVTVFRAADAQPLPAREHAAAALATPARTHTVVAPPVAGIVAALGAVALALLAVTFVPRGGAEVGRRFVWPIQRRGPPSSR